MEILKVGELFNKDKTSYMEGCRFDIDSSGANLFIYLNNPTKDEIESCKKGKAIFKFIKLDSVIFFVAKLGLLQTLDCPYNVHLSKKLSKIEYPGENMGLKLNVYLINAANGILEAMRIIALGENFSRAFIDTIKEQGNTPFDLSQYRLEVNHNYAKYSTKQLDKMCRFYFKTEEN